MPDPRAKSPFATSLALLSFALMAATPLRASLIDPMNNTDGFFSFTVVQFTGGSSIVNPPGYLLPTATANPNSTVTLSNQDLHSDTSEDIIDWRMPGGSNPFIDIAADGFLTLNLTSVNSGFQYDVNLLYFGSGSVNPTFLGEVAWLVNTDGTNLSHSINTSTLAPAGSAQYFVRFRLLPPNQAGDAITLDSIITSDTSTTPEPGGFSLVLGALTMCFVARFATTQFRVR